MVITVNGKREELKNKISLLDFLKDKTLNPDVIVVEYNRSIISKDDLNKIILENNDFLEILSFVSGG